jgi:hypothetical protein
MNHEFIIRARSAGFQANFLQEMIGASLGGRKFFLTTASLRKVSNREAVAFLHQAQFSSLRRAKMSSGDSSGLLEVSGPRLFAHAFSESGLTSGWFI